MSKTILLEKSIKLFFITTDYMDVCPEEMADGILWPATIVHENAYHKCLGGASGKYGLLVRILVS